MKKYTCSWSKLPENLKTKTSLFRMGIYETGPVVAQIKFYDKTFDLYDVTVAMKLEQKKGNKNLVINSGNKDDYLIMEMLTTGDKSMDEIVQLVLINMDGTILFNEYFNPTQELSKKALERSPLNKFFLKKQGKWADKWEELRNIIKDKVLLIPDTSYGTRLLKQTCKRYGIDIDFQLNVICSRETIQHKFNLLKLFELTPTEIKNPLRDCFDTLKILYPKSVLYNAQAMAKNYSERLCEYNMRLGDVSAYQKRNDWMLKKYHLTSDELDFDILSYHICKDIIEGMEPTLKALNLI